MMNTTPSAPARPMAADQAMKGILRPYERELTILNRTADLLWIVLALRVSLAMAGWEWADRYTMLAAVACALFSLTAEIFNLHQPAPARTTW